MVFHLNEPIITHSPHANNILCVVQHQHSNKINLNYTAHYSRINSHKKEVVAFKANFSQQIIKKRNIHSPSNEHYLSMQLLPLCVLFKYLVSRKSHARVLLNFFLCAELYTSWVDTWRTSYVIICTFICAMFI